MIELIVAHPHAFWLSLGGLLLAAEMLGGNGYLKAFPLERFLRDAKMNQIGEGTSEIHKTLIGRHVLRRAAALPQHPVSFHEGYGLTDAGTRERLIATAEQQGRAIVDPLVAEAAAAGVTAEAVATPCATVHDGIIAAATHHGCDLIFMASHGRRGIGALLLGSETQKVLTHSKIPVLVHR